MRESMMNGPTIASRTITLVTTTTSYYWGTTTLGVWYIDLGSISTNSRFLYHTWWPDTFAVYRCITTGLVSGDVITPRFLDDTDPGFATSLQTLSFETFTVATSTSKTTFAVGDELRYAAPRQSKRYVCLAIYTGGQITGSTWEAFFEEGAKAAPLL